MASGFVLQPRNVAEDRKAEFTAVQAAPGTEEQYSGSTLLVVAYLAIWVILMAWIFVLWRRQASLSTRLDGLEAAIDRAVASKGASKPGPGSPGAAKAAAES
jgi:CcmD family protein